MRDHSPLKINNNIHIKIDNSNKEKPKKRYTKKPKKQMTEEEALNELDNLYYSNEAIAQHNHQGITHGSGGSIILPKPNPQQSRDDTQLHQNSTILSNPNSQNENTLVTSTVKDKTTFASSPPITEGFASQPQGTNSRIIYYYYTNDKNPHTDQPVEADQPVQPDQLPEPEQSVKVRVLKKKNKSLYSQPVVSQPVVSEPIIEEPKQKRGPKVGSKNKPKQNKNEDIIDLEPENIIIKEPENIVIKKPIKTSELKSSKNKSKKIKDFFQRADKNVDIFGNPIKTEL